MIAHLAASSLNLKHDLPYLQKIANTIYTYNGALALDWIGPAQRDKVPRYNLDWPKIVERQLDAIRRADIVIMEASTYAFHHGFQLSFALTNNKPTLFLFREQGGKYSSFDGVFVSGITHDLFVKETYKTKKDLGDLVANFIEEYVAVRAEVSLELYQNDISQLHSLADRSGKSIASVVQDLLKGSS